MHLALKRLGVGFLLVYSGFFLESFLKQWLPAGFFFPQLDVALLGLLALKGPLPQAVLLGMWSGILRDSLTVGPFHGWTLCLVSFSWMLAFFGQRRLGFVKKTLLFVGGLAAVHAFLFRSLPPALFMTSLVFLLGIRFLLPWLSDSASR